MIDKLYFYFYSFSSTDDVLQEEPLAVSTQQCKLQ